MKLLIVVDMQTDFTTGALGSEAAQAIVPAVARRIEDARKAGETVWFTLDTHGAGYSESQEGKNLPVLHCFKGEPGWDLDPAIEQAADPGMRRFEKNGFGAPDLIEELARMTQDAPRGEGLEIEICGLCTDICVAVMALSLKGRFPEAKMRVHPALTAGLTPESGQAALTVMRSCQIEIS